MLRPANSHPLIQRTNQSSSLKKLAFITAHRAAWGVVAPLFVFQVYFLSMIRFYPPRLMHEIAFEQLGQF